jgi:hypothetical protein
MWWFRRIDQSNLEHRNVSARAMPANLPPMITTRDFRKAALAAGDFFDGRSWVRTVVICT